MKFSSEDVQRMDSESFWERVEEGDLSELEGLACRGASQAETYANGLTRDLKDEGIAPEDAEPSDLFDEIILREVGDERQDVILPFAEGNGLGFSKMSIWRTQNPIFKWISDYLDQEMNAMQDV